MSNASNPTSSQAPSFAHATVRDAMHPGILTSTPDTPLAGALAAEGAIRSSS